ncbi:YceI family protein [Arcticibacter eurypsychrophilus]|uniref:YceI family protein n=1 Tax=Arcticibacter eurypsychrophilus TaxID=1434752 RepID=UPI00084DFCEC|nr:YceI family protein [Arcticibacter eurypsychrophilus]
MKKANITPLRNRYQTFMILFLSTICAISFTPQAGAQTFKAVAGSEIKVLGSSNIHDWTMEATSFTGDAQLVFKAGNLQDVSSFSFTLPVKNLKGKEGLLNTRAHKALKADKFTTITFKLSTATVTPLTTNQYTIKATGALTISGVTKTVTLQAKGIENTDGTVTVSGSRKIKMSEFEVEPPSFMLGALKVTDDVTVNFSLKLKK